MNTVKLFKGDNIESLKSLSDNSIDSVVTDPPYGLSFMNKKWDYDVPSVEFWKEVYRVLKPGGHVLSFGGTRTYHRMVVNIEDAGFEIRDQIQWIYGSGFPKSHNIGLNIDKKNGVMKNRGKAFVVAGQSGQKDKDTGGDLVNGGAVVGSYQANNEWSGWGTALKPANEPICVARKPLSEKSVAENVLKWRTGGINIDGCRVETNDTYVYKNGPKGNSFSIGKEPDGKRTEPVEMNSEGRFPANIIFDEIAGEMLDEQSGISKSSRFFYQAKVSKKERNMGLDIFEEKETKVTNYHDFNITDGSYKKIPVHKNTHPTVKPIALMMYLCRLVTPPNGIVLDPYMGSGSTGIAAQLESFSFYGMEMDPEYYNIAEARIKNYEMYRDIIK